MVSPNEIVASVDYENIDGFRIRMGCVTVGSEGIPQPFEPTHYVRRDIHRNEIGEFQKKIEFLEARLAKADALARHADAQLAYMDLCDDKGDYERNLRSALAAYREADT